MKYLIVLVLSMPMMAHAVTPPENFSGLVGMLLDIVEALIEFVVVLTFVLFIWGIARAWIFNPGDLSKIEAGRQTAFAGIIGLVVAISIWGIVKILKTGLLG